MDHLLRLTLLGIALGVGATVLYGGLAVAGVIRPRTGWAMAIFGMCLTLFSLCGLALLLWDAGFALLRTIPEFWRGASSGASLMLLLGCLAVWGVARRARRIKVSLEERIWKGQSAIAEAEKRHRVDLGAAEAWRLDDKEAFEVERGHFQVALAEAEAQHQSDAKALERLRESEARHLDALEQANAQRLANQSALDAAEARCQAAETEVRRQTEQAAEARAEIARRDLATISVELSVHHLTYAYPDTWGNGAQLEAAFQKRAFALLTIKNTGEKNLHGIVAECRLINREIVPCHWSKESDGKFSLGGRHAEDLNVYQQRVLVIAQVFENEEKLWARLPTDQSILFSTSAFSSAPFGQHIVSAHGEALKMDDKAELIVELHAEGGVNHTEHIFLSFDGKGPTISRLP